MADYLVTGIAPTADPAQVSHMLAGNSFDESRLSTVSKASAQGRMQANNQHGAPTLNSSSTIMTGAGGTGVPGIGGSHASLGSVTGHGGGADYLGGIPLIPPDQAEHFNVAIAEGRTLVMYKAAPEEAGNVEAAFRAAGLRNVKIFRPKEQIA